MSGIIPESELIINNRGAIYHLDVKPEELGQTVITVGDPDRVKEVSKYFDNIEVQRQHREFITHTGTLGSKRISVVSTGIGPDNIDIVFNELDALVNIDFTSRTIKEKLTTLHIIRIGTCGSLQEDIPVDGMVAGTYGLGIDNLLNYYLQENNVDELELLQQFIRHTQIDQQFSMPYINAAGSSLLKHFVDGFHHGITVTCPGFYGPQGRVLRLGLKYPNFVDLLGTFSYGTHRIANFEMETSAMYGLGKLLGHQVLSINAVVANRVARTFSKDGKAAVENTIQKVLERISEI
ncbi:phosphorylase [Arachidicoccus ginsenosidimutans]|uniref:nucleoside phosphorylase n=1 Tax=Arachidicoccus sp. BS20 TaxID=1850526 RepID=UPI0007F0D7DE|nr:nucleoside phosphorylase [Arachidicoccus sp. BS20]ANI88415.1 phosphorylase [Arachidicoccus sp. BS20]